MGRGCGRARGRARAHGVAVLHAVEDPRLAEYAPEAIGKALGQLIERDRPIAVVGPGSERGAEVMAHAAARTGLPLTANVTEVRPGDPWQATRQRWGGSLLEEARLDGPIRLLTVAPHAVEPAVASAPSQVDVQPFAPALTTATSASGSPLASRPRPARSRWPTPASSSVAAAASGARRASPSSTSSPRCSVARSGCRAS